MALQYSVGLRNAQLDALETEIGASPILKVFSGAEPANCAAADPAGLLCTMNLPADWMNAAAGGQKTMKGNWTGVAGAAGVAASWRIYDNGLTACHIQGDTGDMVFDNTNIANGQTVTVTEYTLGAGNQ